jgi:hypothetical protein
VLGHLQPELVSIPNERLFFLNIGHYLQEAVEDFLVEYLPADWQLLKGLRESEVFTRGEEWTSKGHVDGVLQGPTGLWLLEVKAVKDANFKKILKADDWRVPYASYGYIEQSQMYLSTEVLAPENGAALEEPELNDSIFVFLNRDTADMIGGVEIDHPIWTYRKDMIEYPDHGAFVRLDEKLEKASAYILQETVPEDCDAPAYCFFCGIRGAGARRDTTKRVCVSRQDGDIEEADEIEQGLNEYAAALWNMRDIFAGLDADIITLDREDEPPLTIKKADYE